MDTGMIGEIRLFGGNFAPREWAYCNGQLLSINANQALFSILGTTYGGDGRTTFGLPDLRGRTAIGTGHGPGLTDRKLGQRSGQEEDYITVDQMASHTHFAVLATGAEATVSIPAFADAADSISPDGNVFATGENNAGEEIQTYATSQDSNMAPFAATVTGTAEVSNNGQGRPINNVQPSIGLNYIICMQGTYPSRS